MKKYRERAPAVFRFLSLCLPCLTILTFLLAGCPSPTTGGVSHTFSGTVRDSLTGAGVSGVELDFATHTATTASDGSFSIELGSDGGTISGAFKMQQVGYATLYQTPVSLDASTDTQLVFYITSTNPMSYPTHAVKVIIQDKDSVEIAAGKEVDFYILNSATGYYDKTNRNNIVSYTTGGYTLDTPTFGNDCLVAATIYESGYPSSSFNVMQQGVDLSASSQTITLTQDSGTNTQNVTVTGDAQNDFFQLWLSSPYGPIGVGDLLFSGASAVEVLSVANPYGYAGYWVQLRQISDYLGSGQSKMFMSIAGPAPVGTSVTLPTIDASLGPTQAPDQNSIAYAAATGTLSITAVSSAGMYQFQLKDATKGTYIGLMSNSASIGLPAWLRLQLAGDSVEVKATAIDSNWSLDLPLVAAATKASYGFPLFPGKGGMVSTSSSKTLTF